LKDASDFKIVGRRTARIDGPEVVSGKARYGIDVKVPEKQPDQRRRPWHCEVRLGTKSTFARPSSPDQKWEHVGGDEPKIVKAGTNKVALDLEGIGGVVWAPDSKRFACYSGGGGRWHTTSLYELRGDEWKELKEPSPEEEVQAVAENHKEKEEQNKQHSRDCQ
jgi:hypothetical protein